MPEITFDPISFAQAIEYFEARLALTPTEFAALEAGAKDLAFTISRVTSLDVLNEIQTDLDRALDEGLSMQEFRISASELLERKGFEGLTPFRADNIFRTNIQTAFQVGRYKQMTEPAVIKARPYWMYLAVDDGRSRPTHLAHHRKVYPADHSFWDVWYPPNGYRCRCTIVTVSEAEVEAQGLRVEESVPTVAETDTGVIRLHPDEGFEHNPGKVAWEIDLSKYPEDLRQAFEAVRAARN